VALATEKKTIQGGIMDYSKIPTGDAVQDLITRISDSQQTVMDVVTTQDEAGNTIKKLIVEKRKVAAEDPRPLVKEESKPRSHIFYNVKGFVDFLTKYGKDTTVVFSNPNEGRVQAVLDDRLDRGGTEIVTFEPLIHPRWATWAQLLAVRRVALAQFADFLGWNRRAIIEPDGRDLMLMLSQVKGSTSIELYQGKGKRALNGLLIKTNIQGSKGEEIVELPETITLQVPLYVQTQPVDVEIDLCIETTPDGTGIFVTLNSGDVLDAKLQAFDEMCFALEPLKKTPGMVVTMGAPDYAEWNYLKPIS